MFVPQAMLHQVVVRNHDRSQDLPLVLSSVNIPTTPTHHRSNTGSSIPASISTPPGMGQATSSPVSQGTLTQQAA